LEDAGDDGIDRAAVADYRAYLHGNNCIDLEEVVPYFVMQMRTDQKLRHEVLTAVSFLFVDEFQDLNAAQYELVTMLAGRARVFAIGDPDQAIYGFRGSRPEFFFRFVEEFGAEHLTLTKNYRSAPEILEAAAAVIGRNPSDLRRPQLALALKTGSIEYYAAGTDRDEADFVVQCIEEAMGGISHFSLNSGRGGEGGGQSSLAFSDIAVFYRLTQQAAELCTALQKRGIPFQVVGVPPFYMAPAVRAVYYWLRVADGQAEIEEHLALIRHLKGVGATTIRQLENQLLFADDDFFTAVTRIPLAPKTKGILNELKVLIGLFRNKVIKAGLAASLLEVFDWLRIEAELPEAGRLYELAGSFGDDLPGFSAYLKRNSQATVYDKEAESVSLMTMHAAKGLEFPMVFITGLEEDILPCTLLFGEGRPAEEAPDPVREERRLFFVALTRAEERLVLTSSAIRMVFGKKRGQQPSRFLAEIPTQLVTHRKRARKKRKKQQTAVQMKLF
jgi:superfamily I DNA/RNA helicase